MKHWTRHWTLCQFLQVEAHSENHFVAHSVFNHTAVIEHFITHFVHILQLFYTLNPQSQQTDLILVLLCWVRWYDDMIAALFIAAWSQFHVKLDFYEWMNERHFTIFKHHLVCVCVRVYLRHALTMKRSSTTCFENYTYRRT